ncbi:hypothetical protein BCR34DRAFT_89419 [Clohesyomyces aquaticus]|uniref:Uncharacterized protein n=1 Tax=Clohesyomyces aquaticus TaxID=1231657 RepID=A0A1Y1YVI7_9PLEO|nr:hypothetical protein BCR34DRAFT_89419 [Clohesyomyces aquaticus]
MPFLIYVPLSNRPYLTENSIIVHDCQSWGWQVDSRCASDPYLREIQKREKQLKRCEPRPTLPSIWSRDFTSRLGVKSTDVGRIYSRRKSMEEDAFDVPDTFQGFRRMKPKPCSFQPLATWLNETEEILPETDFVDAVRTVVGEGLGRRGGPWRSRDGDVLVELRVTETVATMHSDSESRGVLPRYEVGGRPPAYETPLHGT